MAYYLPRLGAILAICSLVVLLAICMVGLLKPNSLNAGILPSNPMILPAQAMPGDPNAPTDVPPTDEPKPTDEPPTDVPATGVPPAGESPTDVPAPINPFQALL